MDKKYLDLITPSQEPEVLFEHLTPDNKLIHQGVFSRDLSTYYYTISDKDFQRFDVFEIHQNEGKWSDPKPTFFNSESNEHGTSFSPDGKTLFFSSTRPTGRADIIDTWHIWSCIKLDSNHWSEPTFLEIPNTKNKVTSHASSTANGDIFYHKSNLDFSEMNIYKSTFENNEYTKSQLIDIPTHEKIGKCTPYIALDESYLIYATIGQTLDLYISFKSEKNTWNEPIKLPDSINQEGQGNPSITSDGKFLIYTTGEHQEKEWKINWVNIDSWINSLR